MSDTEYMPAEPNAALVVGPNDHLVVTLPAGTDGMTIDHFVMMLRERFGERVTVMCGVEQIAVVRS